MVETLGSRLKQLRISKNLRQDQLGNLLGANKSAIHYYENDMREPSCDTLIRLAGIFNVSTDYLLGCKKENTIDVSGLTAAEISTIRTLVEGMAQKNKRLEGQGKAEYDCD